jgi:bifunctional DNase/RNase
MLIEMTIKGLMVDPITNMPIVILKDKVGERVLPIWVGIFEANAIALQMENIATPRPMTHDLLRNVITDLEGSVDRVVVSDLKDNTFYAIIHLTVGDRRTSKRRHRAGAADAIADSGGGDRHRQREDGGLRVGAGRQRSAAEVARESRPRGARQVQDVSGWQPPTDSLSAGRHCVDSSLLVHARLSYRAQASVCAIPSRNTSQTAGLSLRGRLTRHSQSGGFTWS